MYKLKRRVILAVSFVVFFIGLFTLFNHYYDVQKPTIKIQLELNSTKMEPYTIYYDTNGNQNWNEIDKDVSSYKEVRKTERLTYVIPANVKNIRIDFADQKKTVKLMNVKVYHDGELNYSGNRLLHLFSAYNSVETKTYDDSVKIKCYGTDPYIIIQNFDKIANKVSGRPSYVIVTIVAISIVLGAIIAFSLKGLIKSIKFVREALSNKKLIISLAKNDFKQKYVSSYLGVIWGFIQPLITIVVYWFVFQVAFRSGDVNNSPFILWFISGIIPWFFFSEALPSATNSFLEYSYLVKKVVFKIEILPVVKIVSAVFVHLFFIIFLFVVMILYGRYPNIYSIQFIYYSFAMMVLVFSVTVFTASVMLFFRDLGQIIGIIVNVGFWATPIGWQLSILPESLSKVFKLNPMYYIVTGYRDSFINKVFVWQRPYETLYFWVFCVVVFLLGVRIYYKLKPHFSDVI